MKYTLPENVTIKPPKMNKDLWKIMGKWQKKSDLIMAYSQRLVAKSVAGVIKMNEMIASLPRATRQLAMQTTVDIVSMLGKVDKDISMKRKTMVRPSLREDYKTLSYSTEVTENLFGDNVTQEIKDINLKKKIANVPQYGKQYNKRYNNGNRSYRGYRNQGNRRWNNYDNYNNNDGSFLWNTRGRNRGQNRDNGNRPSQPRNPSRN